MNPTNPLFNDVAPAANVHRHGSQRLRSPVAGSAGSSSSARPCVGPWELVHPLGRGQWATVYAGRPAGSPEDWPADYAIKVALSDGEQARQAQRLLSREAAVLCAVTHPHLVAMLSAHLDTQPPLIVMPRVSGATLDTALAQAGRCRVPHALWIARQVAEALAALHAAGWIHADIKPGNIHVAPAGHVTLIDLGFALRLDSAECAAGAALRGTLAYTSPEMISAAVPVDGRSDVYGLGVTLYEMLVGVTPFDESDPGRLMLAHLQKSIPNPRHVLPTLHHGVGQLLQDMLAKEPLRRPIGQELIDRLVDLEIATLEERAE